MRVLIATMPYAGHIHPMQPVAAALVRRGHAVAWLTSPSHAHLISPTGASFLPSPPALASHDETPLAPDPGSSGLAAVVSTLRRLFLDRVPAQVAAYRAVLRSTFPAADVLLVDLCAHGAHAHRDLTGLPYATLGINPLVSPDPEVPPWGTGWPPPTTFFGRWLNVLAHAATNWLLYPQLTATLNAHRAALGLPPLPPASGFYDAARSDALHIMPTTPAFEFPRAALHPAVRFVGPLPPLLADADFPPPGWWDELLAHPRDKVVHVTQGTYATAPANLIGPTLAALRDRDDLLVIVTTPDADEVLLPANARAAAFVPHTKLLPHVGAMVTNAGYNGVLAALRCGVPLVCAGRSEDKADVGGRVAWSGAGVDLATDTPTEGQLREAVGRVLAEEGFRRAAERIRDDFATHDGPEEAVDALEEVVERSRR